MAEAMFEILLFSAYLSAALISVVIAVYAISVSYLGRETARSILSLKKRQTELRSRIKKFEERMDVEELEKEIKMYRLEETDLKAKLRFLSVNGAVLLPLAALFLGLLFSLLGMYMYSDYPQQSSSYIIATLVANVAGIGFLLKVLKTIEWAALRVPLPKFEVSFKTGLSEEKIKTKEQKGLHILISNAGEIIAEDLECFVGFPPEFNVIQASGFTVSKQSERESYPGYTAAVLDINKLHIDTRAEIPEIIVSAPEKTGKYKIIICIKERKTGESEHELFLQVVD